MTQQISDIEKKVLAVIQHGLPQTPTPYADAAQKIGIETPQLLEILKNWETKGCIRRIGAIVNHFKIGISAGAMVVWKVPPDQTERIGTMLAAFDQVSHAYQRQTKENWPYDLYTMVHGPDRQQVEQTVKKMSDKTGISDYRILITERELKKVPPTYINPNQYPDIDR